jgi:hypothetical protein
LGQSSVASSTVSTAMGQSTTASGSYSTSMGAYNLASGYCSTATGYNTKANSWGSFVVGAYNVGLSSAGATPSTTNWVPTDPLFEIGNGTQTLSDALVVYKNGNASFPAATSTVTASAFVTTAASGDIPMYTGN